MFSFKKRLYEDDNTGALYVEYTPVLGQGIGAGQGMIGSGEITFAAYTVGVGEPLDMHEFAQRQAIQNAKQVLRHLIEQPCYGTPKGLPEMP